MSDDGWFPIESAPKEGVFLVWLPEPEQGSNVMPMNSGKITTIGHYFVWDVQSKPTHWRPLPSPPTARGEK